MERDDPVLLITGASSGIGAATAKMAANHYRLILTARRRHLVEELAASLGGPERAIGVECDVTQWDQVEASVSKGLDHFGRIDAVYANAGFGAKRGFLEESVEHWESMILTNVYGVALTIRAALPHLLERGDGHVLVTSSIAGRRVLPGSLYSASKFAVTAIAEALRLELRSMHGNHGIRVTSIEPGMTDTDFFDQRPGDGVLQDSDIARAVVYSLDQPPGVDVNEILIRPTNQDT